MFKRLKERLKNCEQSIEENNLELDYLSSRLQSKTDRLQNQLELIKTSNEKINSFLEQSAVNIENVVTSKLNEISKIVEADRESLNLLLNYLGLHIENINDKFIVPNEKKSK